MKNEEFFRLKYNLNNPIFVRGFLSTSQTLEVAESFLEANYNSDMTNILLEIQYNAKHWKFLNKINSISEYFEEEILFDNQNYMVVINIEDKQLEVDQKPYLKVVYKLADFQAIKDFFTSNTLHKLEKLKEIIKKDYYYDTFYLYDVLKDAGRSDDCLIVLGQLHDKLRKKLQNLGKKDDSEQKLYKINAILAFTYTKIGHVYFDKPDLKNALESYEMALETIEMLFNKNLSTVNELKQDVDKNSLAYSNALRNVGLCYYNKGNWETASSYYFKSVEICNTILHLGQDSSESFGKTQNNLGIIYHKNGSLKEALHYYELSLIEKEKAEGKLSISYAKSYYNIVIIHRTQLSLAKIIICLVKYFNEKSTKIDEFKIKLNEKFKLGFQENILEEVLGQDKIDAAKQIIDLNDAGKYFDKFKSLSSVVAYFEEILKKIKETTGRNLEYSNFAYFLGQLYRFNKQQTDSINYFKEALEVFSNFKLNNDILYTSINIKLGKVLCKEKDFSQAMEYYETALNIFAQGERNNNNFYLCLTLKSLGDLYKRMKDLPLAESSYKKCLNAKESLENQVFNCDDVKLFKNLGKIYFDSDRLDEASEVFYKCLIEIQKLKSPKNK